MMVLAFDTVFKIKRSAVVENWSALSVISELLDMTFFTTDRTLGKCCFANSTVYNVDTR